MIYQVLIVDDEPYVTESISVLLQKQCRHDMEIHVAYRAQQALEIIRSTRIDLLLTDIQMPGMDGLTLIRQTRQLCPECAVAVLSAYSRFDYAYEAMNCQVEAYILKTEEESEILRHLNTVFDKMEARLNHAEWLAKAAAAPNTDSVRQSMLMKALFDAQISRTEMLGLVEKAGLRTGEGRLVPLLAQSKPGTKIAENLLCAGLRQYLGANLEAMAAVPLTEERYFVLLQTDASGAFLSSMLEMLQEALWRTAGQELSFVADAPWDETTPLYLVRSKLKRAAARLETGFELCVMEGERPTGASRVTVAFLRDYIGAHINEDLSLMQLSRVTGYNAAYLSRVFSNETSEPLVRYIARKRMEAVRKLMLDPALTLEQIMTLTHFNSRSYFNSFVKRETGLSPKKYRAQAVMENPDGAGKA